MNFHQIVDLGKVTVDYILGDNSASMNMAPAMKKNIKLVLCALFFF